MSEFNESGYQKAKISSNSRERKIREDCLRPDIHQIQQDRPEKTLNYEEKLREGREKSWTDRFRSQMAGSNHAGHFCFIIVLWLNQKFFSFFP